MVDIKDTEEEEKAERRANIQILRGIRQQLAIHRANLGIAQAYILGLDVLLETYKQYLEHLPEGPHSVVELSELLPVRFKSIPILGAKIDAAKVNPARAARLNLMLAKRQASRCRRWEETAIKDQEIREAYFAKLVGNQPDAQPSP